MLESQVSDALQELEKDAYKYQQQGRAYDKFKSAEEYVQEVKAQDPVSRIKVDVYSKLDKIIQELRRQRSRLAPARKAWGQDIIAQCEKLKAQILKDIEQTGREDPEADQESDTRGEQNDEGGSDSNAQANEEQSETAATSATRPNEGDSGSNADSGTASTTAQAATRPSVPKALTEIVAESGWSMDSACAGLLDIIDRSLADVLGSPSEAYGSVLATIEAKLAAELGA
jgi:hypothetical protein